MSRQLAFDLPAQVQYRRGDLSVSPANALAIATLDGWRDWPGGKLVLAGPAGSGKTHLAHVWAQEAGAALITGADLAGLAEGQGLPALAECGAVAIDDAQRVAGDRGAEAALFHLHNLLAGGGRLLIAADAPPRDWGLELPDLLSRMQAAPLVRLDAPDDALLSAVLAKLFADRQIAVPPNVIPYLVMRMDRSIATARDLVAELDARALAEGRPVTRTLAALVIGAAEPEV